MATELGKAYVQIMPSAKGISGSISQQLAPEATRAGGMAGNLLGSGLVKTLAGVIAAAKIGEMIVGGIKASLNEGAALQQSLGGIDTLFKENADRVKQYASEAYKTTGLSANAYMENVTGFSASLLQSLGGDTKKAADIANMAMIDMADNSNKMGTSMESIQYAYQGFAKQNYTMLDNLKLGYGGTKEEMARLLADAEKLTGKKYDMSNLSDVYQAIHAIQNELDITGTTSREAEHTFTGSLNAMKASAKDLLGNLALGENIKPSLEALKSTAYSFFVGNFIPMLKNVLSGIPVILGSFIKDGLQIVFGENISSQVMNELTKIREVILTFYDMTFGSLSSKDNVDMLEKVGISPENAQKIVSLSGRIGSTITSFYDMIFGSLGRKDNIDFMKSMGLDQNSATTIVDFADSIRSNFEMVWSTIKQLFGQIPNFISGITSSVVPVLKTIIDGFSKIDFSGIQSLIAAILPALQAGFEKFMSIISPAIDSIVSSFVSLWNTAQPLISILADALMPVFKIIGSFLGGVLSGILTGLSGAFEMIKIAIELLTPVIKILVDGFIALEPVFSWIAEKIGFVIGLFSNLSSVSDGLGSMINSAWSNIQTAISTASSFIGTAIDWIKTAFSGAGSAVEVLKNIFSIAWMAMQDVISAAKNIINTAIDAIKSVFSSFGGGVSGISKTVIGWINNIKNAFNSVKNIDIRNAGRAIIDGFLNGLKSGWDAVTGFVGGIAQWIKEHKGPISYDRKLLIPAGNAIMFSLYDGLKDAFQNKVQPLVSDFADKLSSSFGQPQLEFGIGANVDAIPAITNGNSRLAYQVASTQSYNSDNADLIDSINRLSNRQIVVSAQFHENEFARMVAKPIDDVQTRTKSTLARLRGEIL